MVSIIGGSIAGLTTALKLSSLGIPCTVFERCARTGDKACGEGLAPLGVSILEELGVDWKRFDGAIYPMRSIQIIGSKGESYDLPVALSGGDPTRTGLGIQRESFEFEIRRWIATRPNIVLNYGEEVSRLKREGSTWHVSTTGGEYKSSWVVIASGCARRIFDNSQTHGRGFIPRANLFGTTRRFQAKLPAHQRSVIITPVPGGELFITRTGQDKVNLSFLSGRKEIIQESSKLLSRQSLEYFLDSLDIKLGEELDHSGAGLSLGRRPAERGQNIISVGDAVEILDPIGGLGMTHGLVSGQLAALAIGASLHSSLPASRAQAFYSIERDRQTRQLRRFTSIARLLLRGASEGARDTLLSVSSSILRYLPRGTPSYGQFL